MNRKYAVTIATATAAVALTLFAAEKQAEPTTAEAGSQMNLNERFQAKVLKVFSAKDGDALFRAYLVTWRGQEVVASDRLAASSYDVGDTVTVLALNSPFPSGKAGPRLLSFLVHPG